MPFHEFAKAAILGSRRYYKANTNGIVNVFTPTSVVGASHWTNCRILARLLAAQSAYTPLGQGFVGTAVLMREYRESFGLADDFIRTADNLLLSGLIESEPPRARGIAVTEALRITATGAYYWSFLVRSFAYLDLVFVDTPVRDEQFAKTLAGLAECRKEDYALREFVRLRIERVRMFLDYLDKEDAREIEASSKQNGPYTEVLSAVVRAQVEKEIENIRGRTGA